ncbi:MAG: NUDIX domain-containing protein [Acidobacteriota bacterium]
MRTRESAGLLMFRRTAGEVEVLLGHPGGPFWAAKDHGAWTILKGGLHPGESALDAARREFTEETGFGSTPPFLELGSIRQLSGKIVHAWAFEGDCDPAALVSITATTEWPYRSGVFITVPEIDRARFFTIAAARLAINVGQAPLIDRLVGILATPRT